MKNQKIIRLPSLVAAVFVVACTNLVCCSRAPAQEYYWSNFAGTPGGPGAANGTGNEAEFDLPQGVAVDGSGNVYVADTLNSTIRKVTPRGVVTTLAGFSRVSGTANGTGSAARFRKPNGVAVDGSGNVYVADTLNSTIRKVTPQRVVTTLAGTPLVMGTANGTGSAALFNGPAGVAVDGSGNIYVADSTNNTIRKVTSKGVVTTLAGAPLVGGSANGTAGAARFYDPTGVAVDGSGNVYVADTGNNTIRKVTPKGVVTTLAGNKYSSLFVSPGGVAVDRSGNVYVADILKDTIQKVTPEGVVTTLAGNPEFSVSGTANGIGSAARFDEPRGVAVDGSGNAYVADTNNSTIRKVTPQGVVTTLAGNPGVSGTANGTGGEAEFDLPQGVTVDRSGNVYVADRTNCAIRKVTPHGVVTTLAGDPRFSGTANGTGSAARFRDPIGAAVDGSGNVYVADTGNEVIRKVTPKGMVTTLTGSAALFIGLSGVAVDGSGNLYVSDEGLIQKMTPKGVLTTLAGSPILSDNSSGVAVDGIGNVYVADSTNNTIWKVTPKGVVTTLAGTPYVTGTANGTGSAALFNNPSGVAVDGSGNVYVADTGSSTIRKVTPTGAVTTIGGTPGVAGWVDGLGSAALFSRASCFPRGFRRGGIVHRNSLRGRFGQ